MLKKAACLLALTLFGVFIQSYRSGAAKGDPNARPAAQSQKAPRPDSQKPSETVVPAPSEFKEIFIGSIDNRLHIRMELERKGSDLTGEYFYERAGAYNTGFPDRKGTLELQGRIDGDGGVTLTETETTLGPDGATIISSRKTGEFKGKIEGLSANGDVGLRFSGLWAGGKDAKQMPFSLRQLGFDLGGMKFDYDRMGFEIPKLVGLDLARAKKFNDAILAIVAHSSSKLESEFKDGSSKLESDFTLTETYEVIAANKDFISVLINFNYQFSGQHPNVLTKSFNYDLNRNAPVRLADLFIPKSNCSRVISDYATKELKKLDTVDLDNVGPWKDFHSWNITPAGLKIIFDPYEVGPWIVGFHEVIVPYSVLKPIIKRDGLLAQFTK